MVAALYAKDLEAMTGEMLAFKSGKSRSGFDLTYEVVALHRLVIAGATGTTLPRSRPEGWMTAPESYASKEVAIADFKASIEELMEAVRGASPERLDAIVESPLGPLPVSRLVGIVPMHIMYHSGQLNYIQTLHGDDELHWG